MKFILLSLLLCTPLISAAQKSEIFTTNKSEAEKLCDSAVNLWQQNKLDCALQTINEALTIARQNNDSLQTARALTNTGLIYSSMGDAAKSIFYYEQAIHLLRQLKDDEKLYTTLLNIGIAYKEQAIYDKALKYLFEASDFFEKKKQLKNLSAAYNTIGNIFMLEKRYTKALEFHSKALLYRKEIEYNKGIAGSLNNIGIIYKKLEKYDSALIFFNNALLLKENNPDPVQEANTISHIAEVYLLTSNFKKAEEYYLKAYYLQDSSNNKKGIAHSFYDLGYLFFTKKNYKKAETYLLQSIRKSEEINAEDVLLKNYNLLRKLYRKTNNFSKALLYDDLYILIYEEQLGQENQKILTQTQVRYETEKKQNEIQELNREKEKREAILLAQQLQLEAKKTHNRNLSIVMVLMGLIVILLGVLYNNKQSFAKRLDNVLREMHHRVKNNFQVLLSIFSLQKEHINDDSVNEMIDSNIKRIAAMGLIHKNLYANQDLTEVKLAYFIRTLIGNIQTAYNLKDKNITVVYEIDSTIDIEVDKAISLALIINELVTNAFKYAFGGDNTNPVLKVTLTRNANGKYELLIKDNGKKSGLEIINKSFGLKLVDSQIKRIRGSMDRRVNNGVEYKITF